MRVFNARREGAIVYLCSSFRVRNLGEVEETGGATCLIG
jgi:hypothetical protein